MSVSSSLLAFDGYVGRVKAAREPATGLPETVRRPDVYALADHILRACGRRVAVDVGCGRGDGLLALRASRHIGLDRHANIGACRKRGPDHTWITTEFDRPDLPDLPDIGAADAVVLCTGLIDELDNPLPLLTRLATWHAKGAIVLLAAAVHHGATAAAASSNIARRGAARRSPRQLEVLLEEAGLPCVFSGNLREPGRTRAALTIHDKAVSTALANPRRIYPPLALIGGEVHGPATVVQIAALEREGVEVRILSPNTTISGEAAEYPGRWVIALEPGEIPGSPWDGLNLRQALGVVEATGAQAVTFSIMDMARARFSSRPSSTPEPFAFSADINAYTQVRAWRQGSGTGSFFAGLRRCPYAFHCRSYGGAGRVRALHQGLRSWMTWSPRQQYRAGFHDEHLVERLSDVAANRVEFLSRLQPSDQPT